MELCPRCNKEILPYLKTGEFKQVVPYNKITSYQFYFCIHCKIVYWKEHEEFEFLSLEGERAKKNEGIGSKGKGVNKQELLHRNRILGVQK